MRQIFFKKNRCFVIGILGAETRASSGEAGECRWA